MDGLDIPDEALELFPWRQMWVELYEDLLSRNRNDIVDMMDNIELTEYEIYQESIDLGL